MLHTMDALGRYLIRYPKHPFPYHEVGEGKLGDDGSPWREIENTAALGKLDLRMLRMSIDCLR